MRTLPELLEEAKALAGSGHLLADTYAALRDQVERLAHEQARVENFIMSYDEAVESLRPDGSALALSRWREEHGLLVGRRKDLAALVEQEVYLRAELERAVWLAQHRHAQQRSTEALA